MAIAAALSGWAGLAVAATPTAGAAAATPATPTETSNASAPLGTFADFDRNLLAGGGINTANLARFAHGNPVLPGDYSTDISLNGSWVGRSNVRFAAESARASATPCVDQRLLDQLGLHPEGLSEDTVAQLKSATACVAIGDLIPGASMNFDVSDLRLEVSVPQAYLGQLPRGYVSPEYWDAGVPAALLNYSFNGYRSSNHGFDQTTSYLGLNGGVNVGPWHLRQVSTFNWQSSTGDTPSRSHWENIQTYAQRDLPTLQAQLTLGDSYTDGSVFDSYGVRGVQLATDDRMLPESLRGYAPVVHGTATTNARVAVSQNGQQIYETTVAPGPFTINDLYPTGYGGNLVVTVTEADGRTHSFSVPYASVAQLLRSGTTRFGLVAGQLRNASLSNEPNVVQATLQHGFSNLLTGYAGVVGSEGYAAVLIGGAINTRYGAFALDVTQADTHLPSQSAQFGQSVRLSYSKIIPDTHTSLTVAAYRYSSSGYFSLTDAAIAREYARGGLAAFDYVPTTIPSIDGTPEQGLLDPAQSAALSGSSFSNTLFNDNGLQRPRSTFSITMNQQLGSRGGSLYLNALTSDYWNRSGTDRQFQLGYNNSFRRLSYGVSATRMRDAYGHYDNQYMLTFSLPVGVSAHAPSFSANLTHDSNYGVQDQATLSGTLGADNQFNYGATVAHSSAADGSSRSVNAGYRSPYAVLNTSYGTGDGYSQSSMGVSGAVVAHPGGITFGQPSGDTVAIVDVPGAAGARLLNAAGARIDHFGYTLVPYLTPYNFNTIQIDPKGLPLDVQLDATSAQVAPHAGAVVMLKFNTQSGRTIIVRARLGNGDALPFGAEVFNDKGVVLGVVGQAGQILVRGVDQGGTLTARWHDEDGTAQSCDFLYQIGPQAKGRHATTYDEVDATCSPMGTLVSNGP